MLKSLFLFLISLALFTSCSTKKEFNSFSKEFSVTDLGNDTFVLADKSYYDSNILVAHMNDNSVIIASSPFETQGGLQLIKWIKTKWNPKKIIAINTHFHSDGTGSNEAFQKSGVEIWASDMTKKLHQEKARSLKILEANNFNQNPELKKRIEARNTVFANHTFDEKIGKEFIFDNEKVQLIYPGPGHSPDNLVVYFPKRKVMYGTCMIRGGDSLGYLGDADVKSWASSVRKIKALDVNIIIPGHGLTGGPELIKKTIELAEKEQTRGLSN